METTIVLGFYGDNGKANGNYYNIGIIRIGLGYRAWGFVIVIARLLLLL